VKKNTFFLRWPALKKVDLAKKDYFFYKKKDKLFFTLEFHTGITFFHAGRCSVKKSHFSVKERRFFTLASMKKSRFGKERLFLRQKKYKFFSRLNFTQRLVTFLPRG
jgi:hypothetical protein